ncbi:hypothetical protein DJ568_00270 [Mucilaginibacter hurinus]|uniref:DUF4960 domain-containing protein n=1 Tax=Mucilaginibacter hurinus TaxID=2201324 RepID=A0A367GU52_9SPHI|nr:DUF4960 domain-containing protein [Mucilaginibacter hurinus]RCH56331.1 hypothetical protein DJ568_00270 [Mucilaginibacter hurinus]
MTRYFNHYKAFCLLIAVAALWAGCKKDNKSSFNVNADVTLSAFSINNIQGDIDKKTGDITVNVPFGTDVTNLAAAMQMPGGAKVSPAAGAGLDFTGPVTYRVTNGNLFKDYKVTVKIIPPLSSFKINGVDGVIDHENKTISVILPDGTDLSALKPEIGLQTGVSVSPASGAVQNFTAPVNYIVKLGERTATYAVTVISNSVNEYAFMGVATSRAGITNPDEKAAADWFFATYPAADYVSFQSIEGGRSLANYKVIWWHYDSAQDLPAAALTPAVVNTLKEYRAGGGSLLLTTYAARYVEALGVVPEGRGPNNVFGDFLPGGFIETNNNWGISFRTREDHPIFQGIETYEPGKAWLLEKGTFRLNHTAWWFVNEWGGYGDGAGWREKTGGINLASEQWDDNLNGRVGIAEWPANDGNVVIIAFGAYDWYSEPEGGARTTNLYLGNIKRITKNAIDYIK